MLGFNLIRRPEPWVTMDWYFKPNERGEARLCPTTKIFGKTVFHHVAISTQFDNRVYHDAKQGIIRKLR